MKRAIHLFRLCVVSAGLLTETLAYGQDVSAIACGNCFSLALENDGTAWAWGYNGWGELGNGTTAHSPVPVQVIGLSNVIAIAGGGLHSLALKSDGTVWAWGYNYDGELGNGTINYSPVPVQVIGLSNVSAVSGGSFFSLALKNDGTVWAWGYNGYGELGNGTTVDSTFPVQVIGLSNVIAVAGGWDHSLALKNDGTAWAWGYNEYGQLGNGTINYINVPVQVIGLSNVTAIAAGGDHSHALKSDGTAWAWGCNNDGELGNGTTAYSPVPVQVIGLSNVTAIAAGCYHSLALTTNGIAWAWGYNGSGELGDSTLLDSLIPVRVAFSPYLSPPRVSASDGTYPDKVCVTWNVSIGASGYEIWRNINNQTNSATNIGSANANYYNDSTATPGTLYYYWVKATNSVWISDFSSVDTGYRALAAPAGISASDGTYTDKIRVTWNASVGATGYQVWRNTINQTSSAVNLGSASTNSYEDSTATPGTLYYYWVKATSALSISDFSTPDSGWRAIPYYGTVQFSSSPYSVNENAGTVTLTVTRTGGSFGPASVDYATSNGMALAGADYTSKSGTLSWSDGDTSSKTITVAITDDILDENNESFTVTLRNAVGAGLGSPSSATVTIVDNDEPPVGEIRLAQTNVVVNEDVVNVELRVVRMNGNYGVVSVEYTNRSVTATAGADYGVVTGRLTWADGDASDKVITIPVVDDSADEPDEVFEVVLMNAVGISISGTNVASVTIVDNDNPPAGVIQFAVMSTEVGEAGGSVTLSVVRTGGSFGSASVDYTTADGTATAGADYTSKSGTLSWSDGETSSKTITVSIIDDSLDENNETFTVTLRNAVGAGLGSPSVATVTIVDNEGHGEADLEVSDLQFEPVNLWAGDHPAMISFDLANDGPENLVSPDAQLEIIFHLSSNTTFGDEDDIAIGTTTADITLSAGTQTTIIDPGRPHNTDVTIPEGISGAYYVFVSVRLVSQSGLSDPDGAYAMRDGPIRVRIHPSGTDYDGDGKSDVAVYQEDAGYWYILLSASGEVTCRKFGALGYSPVPGDYDGDGKTDLAVYHEASGYWFVLPSATFSLAFQKFGAPGYAPVSGDFDGDGKTDLAVYHEASGYWFVLPSATSALAFQKFGEPGYTPVPGDYDGDGKTDIAVYQESSGYWYVLLSGSSYSLAYMKFGEPGYKPVSGDFDGDGKTDLAVYHEGSGYWYVLLSASGTLSYAKLGGTGYEPVPGDYNGDGMTDLAVYHEASGFWYMWPSDFKSASVSHLQFGGPGYTPVGVFR